MAANVFVGGIQDETLVFDRAIGHLNVFVAVAVTFALSLDKGENYLRLPEGFHSFPIGPVYEVWVKADGEWSMIAIQA